MRGNKIILLLFYFKLLNKHAPEKLFDSSFNHIYYLTFSFHVCSLNCPMSALAAAVLAAVSTNASLPALSLPPNTGFLPMNFQVYKCFNRTTGTIGIAVFSSVSIVFLLPLYLFILYVGLKQWRQQRAASTPTSHADFLTYKAVLVELLSVLGSNQPRCPCWPLKPGLCRYHPIFNASIWPDDVPQSHLL